MREKHSTAKVIAFTISLLLCLSLFVCSRFAYAAGDPAKDTKAEHANVITSISALLEDGSGPVGDVSQWQVFRLNAEFALPNGQVHAGDTTTITLPDKLRFDQTAGFPIMDTEGNIVANATVNGPNKTITLVYTDFVESHSNIKGDFHVYVKVDRNKVDEPEDIPIEIDVNGTVVVGGSVHFIGIPVPSAHQISKSGWQYTSEDHRTLTFNININTSKEDIKNAVLRDTLQNEGVSVLPETLEIKKGTWAAVHGDWELQNKVDITDQCDIRWGEGNSSYTIYFGDISADEGINIRYNAQTSYDMVDGEKITNKATLTGSTTGSHQATGMATFFEAGGSAEGYVYGITIHKTDKQGNALAGAEFDVIRVSSGASVGTITTGADGEGSITGLLHDDYRLVETKAPEGFKLLDEPILVTADDFDSDKIAVKNIENEPLTPGEDNTVVVTNTNTDNSTNNSGAGSQDASSPGKITTPDTGDSTALVLALMMLLLAGGALLAGLKTKNK